jgi:hypothetical protein
MLGIQMERKKRTGFFFFFFHETLGKGVNLTKVILQPNKYFQG